MQNEILQQIEQIINYNFSDKKLLSEALTHSSAVDHRAFSNERMEFLGDSVLSLVICQILYERFPDYLEGDLTKIKSMLVSRRTCAKIVKDLKLQEFLKIGKGMIFNRALTGSLAAGLLESLIAAVYLDGGLESARSFILKMFGALIEQTDAKQSQGNFKSMLQQYAQQKFDVTPVYQLLDEKGPDHNKCFEVQVVIADYYFQSAWATNKKQAEQKAAFNALVELGATKEDGGADFDNS